MSSIPALLGYDLMNDIQTEYTSSTVHNAEALSQHWIEVVTHFEMCLRILIYPSIPMHDESYTTTQMEAIKYMKMKNNYRCGSLLSILHMSNPKLTVCYNSSTHNIKILPFIITLLTNDEIILDNLHVLSLSESISLIFHYLGQSESEIPSSTHLILTLVPESYFQLNLSTVGLPLFYSIIHFIIDYKAALPLIHSSLIQSSPSRSLLSQWLRKFHSKITTNSDNEAPISQSYWLIFNQARDMIISGQSFTIEHYLKKHLLTIGLTESSILTLHELYQSTCKLQPNIIINTIASLIIRATKQPCAHGVLTEIATNFSIDTTPIVQYTQQAIKVIENYHLHVAQLKKFIIILAPIILLAFALLMPSMYFCLHAQAFSWTLFAKMLTGGIASGILAALVSYLTITLLLNILNALLTATTIANTTIHSISSRFIAYNFQTKSATIPTKPTACKKTNDDSSMIAPNTQIKVPHGTPTS